MTSESYGWTGKILNVDLSELKISTLDTLMYANRFLGGRGVATRIYWEGVAPGVKAFDPDNLLIFMTGPLTATGVPGASRFEVVSKSPMSKPERFCYGNLGGFFGSYMKRAGYDGIVIKGQADHPVYLHMGDDNAEILDGAWLWGKGTYEVQDLLKEKFGKQVRFLSTGPAGENLCRNATINTDNEGSATGGFGAVMGSKRLKAIAITGSGHPKVAHPEQLKPLIRLTMDLSERGTLRMPIPKDHATYIGKSSCYQCALPCLRSRFRTTSGREEMSKCGALTFYVSEAMRRTEEHKIDIAFDATLLCNDYSLCTNEMRSIINWLVACYNAGFLTKNDTGLDMADLGSRKFIEQLVSMISYRKGFGDILADGLSRISERLGEEANAYFPLRVPIVGGGTGYSPRMYYTTALLYAFEPRTPIAMLHEVSYMVARWLLYNMKPQLSPTTAEVFRAAATKFWGHEKAWDLTTYEGKTEAAIIIQDRTYVKDSLILCDCAWPMMDSFNTPDHVGDPALESKLFTAVTGIETGEKELLRYGERILNLQRAILIREGWKTKTNDMPAEFNFTKPIEQDGLNPRLIVPGPTEEPVSIKGNILDRSEYEKMRESYYMLRGWDPETGYQKEKTLEQLDLKDVIGPLKEKGAVI